jgi:hypothetical protein
MLMGKLTTRCTGKCQQFCGHDLLRLTRRIEGGFHREHRVRCRTCRHERTVGLRGEHDGKVTLGMILSEYEKALEAET